MSLVKIVRNAAWNWGGMALGMAVGFIMVPVMMARLTDSGYGLWILMGSLTQYYDFLDLGVRGSVGRFITLHRAKGDFHGVNVTLNTALMVLLGVMALALALTPVAMTAFFHYVTVPPEDLATARLALLLVAVNVAVTFPLSVFDATLWASQRFDLINMVDAAALVTRTVLVLWLVRGPADLAALAMIMLGETVLKAGIKAALSFAIDKKLRLGRKYARLDVTPTLFRYGFWHLLLNVSAAMGATMSLWIIASHKALLGLTLVAAYNVAARLIGYSNSCLVAGTGILTPVAATLHAKDPEKGQQKLFVEGGKYSMALGLFFLTLLTLMGRSLIALWVHDRQVANYSWVLLILVAGEVLPMSQWVTHGMVLGTNRHRFMAQVSVLETVLAVSLALLLINRWGLAGVAWSFAICGAVFRGGVQAVYGCRVARVSVRDYLMRGLGPAVLAAAGPALILAALTRWHTPATWPLLFLYTGAFVAAYALSWGLILRRTAKPAPSSEQIGPVALKFETADLSPTAHQVSVVIPAYRSHATILRALDSVLSQTQSPGQIIVVDDGSPEPMDELLRSYIPRVTLTRQPNGGTAGARNAGIAAASGRLIAFLDADDFWEPDRLERQLEIFRRHPEVSLVASRAFTLVPGSRRFEANWSNGRFFGRVVHARGREAFELGRNVWTSTVLLRREALGNQRFVSGLEPAEDRDLWVRLAARHAFYLIDRPLATGVDEPGSLSRSSVDRDCSSMLKVVRRHGELLEPRERKDLEAHVYRRWAAGHLANGQPRLALGRAWSRVQYQALSPQGWWILLKCATLACRTREKSQARITTSNGGVHG